MDANAFDLRSPKRSSNIVITIGRNSCTVAEWSRCLGRSQIKIYRRLARGWSPERAVLEPARKWTRRQADNSSSDEG